MKRSKRKIAYFIIATLITILTAFADGILTYTATPDLQWEANPIVAILGFGWTTLILTNVVIVSFLIVCYYYSFVLYERPIAKQRNFFEYVSLLFYNRPDEFICSLYKPPSRLKVVIGEYGCAIAFGFNLGRLSLVIDWLIIICNNLYPWMPGGTKGHWFNEFTSRFGLSPIMRCIYITIITFYTVMYYRLYREYKMKHVKRKDGYV